MLTVFILSQDTIRSIRHNKIQTGLRRLDASALKGVKLSNITAMEVSVIRPFMTKALNQYLESELLGL